MVEVFLVFTLNRVQQLVVELTERSPGCGPEMLGVLAFMDQRGSYLRQRHVLGWYCWLLWCGSVL